MTDPTIADRSWFPAPNLRVVQSVTGIVQHYAWGDQEFIPRFLGQAPDGRPWAELWLGTHANGPATLDGVGPLADVTGPLPYLLKVLAAAEPLSLQAHPTKERAVAGSYRGAYPDLPGFACEDEEFGATAIALPPEYADRAIALIPERLQKAGVRLAMMLNRALNED